MRPLLVRVAVVVFVILGSAAQGCRDPRREQKNERARLAVAKMQVVELRKVVELYRTRKGRLPQNWHELLAKDARGVRLLDGTEVPVDPWGCEYRLVAAPDDVSSVVSNGPDRQPGTADDIRAPAK